MVLECKTRGRLLHLAKRFDPKRAFLSCNEGKQNISWHFGLICFVLALQLKKALLGPKRFAKWSSLRRVLRKNHQLPIYRRGNEPLLFQGYSIPVANSTLYHVLVGTLFMLPRHWYYLACSECTNWRTRLSLLSAEGNEALLWLLFLVVLLQGLPQLLWQTVLRHKRVHNVWNDDGEDHLEGWGRERLAAGSRTALQILICHIHHCMKEQPWLMRSQLTSPHPPPTYPHTHLNQAPCLPHPPYFHKHSPPPFPVSLYLTNAPAATYLWNKHEHDEVHSNCKVPCGSLEPIHQNVPVVAQQQLKQDHCNTTGTQTCRDYTMFTCVCMCVCFVCD